MGALWRNFYYCWNYIARYRQTAQSFLIRNEISGPNGNITVLRISSGKSCH